MSGYEILDHICGGYEEDGWCVLTVWNERLGVRDIRYCLEDERVEIVGVEVEVDGEVEHVASTLRLNPDTIPQL